MELEIQKFLRGGNSFNDLLDLYGIKSKRSSDYPELVLFKYSQLESPMGEKIVQECRGIILNEQDNWNVVSRPYDKFFNYGEGHAADLDWTTAKVYDKLDGCFLREQSIDCWDGSLVKIGDIVNKGVRPILIGQDANGNLIPSYITNVKNNGTKNNWLLITLEDKIQQSSSKRSNKLKVTSNHHIFINGGYKEVGSLKAGDKLTTYEYKINDFLKEYIEGSLLGDGYLNPQGGFSESHLSSLVGFIGWQKACLGDLFTSVYNQVSGYGSNMTKVKALVNTSTKELKSKWYIDGKKQVPRNLELTDLVVAKWYLDDGNRAHNIHQKDRANFATNSFTKKECELLADKLFSKYRISVTVFNNKGWNIRINAGKDNSITRFWQAIAPYIPYDMEYKLPEEYRSIPKIVPTPKILKVKKLVSILNISTIENNKSNFPSGRCGYDIETTTNNYFAGGLLVHNSLMTLYWYDGWRVASSGNPDAAGKVWNNNGHIITFKELFWNTFNLLGYMIPSSRYRTTSFMFELMTPLNKVVVQHKDYGLVLHGARSIDLPSEYLPSSVVETMGANWQVCKSYPFDSIDNVLSNVKDLDPIKQEGYIVTDAYFSRVKVKSPQYVALHHMRDSLSPRRMLEIVRANEGSEFLTYFPEFEDLYNEIKVSYNRLIWNLSRKIACLLEEYPSPSRKDIGLATKGEIWQGICFPIIFDGKSLNDCLCAMPIKKLEDWIQKI